MEKKLYVRNRKHKNLDPNIWKKTNLRRGILTDDLAQNIFTFGEKTVATPKGKPFMNALPFKRVNYTS